MVGLYVLSAADEDALLISHATSGQRHYVRRLGAKVLGIAQCSSGSKYLLSLSNNRLKLMNAATFELQTEISGLLCPPRKYALSTVGVLHPLRAMLFLGASSEDDPATLQCYDLDHDQQVGLIEVAKTRRIATTGIENRVVRDVMITHTALSSDGFHLATVDEWAYEYILDDIEDWETTLKYWIWKEGRCELVTKIENPHGFRARILCLAAPNSSSHLLEFATLGSDGSVKTWGPNFDLAKTAAWTLLRTSNVSIKTPLLEGKLRYSPDSTTLMVGIAESIYVLDTITSQVLFCIHVGQSITALEPLSKYALCLSDNSSILSIWDLTNGLNILSERLDHPRSILAVNHSTETFAIAVSRSDDKGSIGIFKLKGIEKKVLAHFSLHADVRCMVPSEASGRLGFVFVDGSGHAGVIVLQSLTEKTSIQNTPSTAVNSLSGPTLRNTNNKHVRTGSDLFGQRWDHDLSSVLETGGVSIERLYELVIDGLGG
jgi:hypothetical protein